MLALDGVKIELCGTWLWVSGETKKHKETLKNNGFFYAPKKQMWYFRPAEQKKGKMRNYKSWTYDDIKIKHGSETITIKEREKLAVNF